MPGALEKEGGIRVELKRLTGKFVEFFVHAWGIAGWLEAVVQRTRQGIFDEIVGAKAIYS